MVLVVRDNRISPRNNVERTLPMSYVYAESLKSVKKRLGSCVVAVETGESPLK